MLRLCYRLIICSTGERSQAPKTVTVTDLFYLRGMDVGSVNVPYLLASLRLERKPDVAVGALVVVENALVVDESALARLARVEEEVHKIRGTLGKQHEVMDAMARGLSRFTVWAAGGISQLLDFVRATYVRYSKTHVPYQRRRVRQRTGDTNTSAAPLYEDQPDP
nr:hypothetical protein [Tanacetum cinerariifolium]